MQDSEVLSEDEFRYTVVGLLKRGVGALETLSKIAKQSWQREKKRQREMASAAAPPTQALISVGRESEVCIYCQTKSRRVMRGNLIVGCVHCITEAFGESLRRESGIIG